MMPAGKLVAHGRAPTPCRSPSTSCCRPSASSSASPRSSFFLGLSDGRARRRARRDLPARAGRGHRAARPRSSAARSSAKLDDAVVDKITARPEVARRCPRMSLAFPADRLRPASRASDRSFEVGGFADGIDPRATSPDDPELGERVQGLGGAEPPAAQPCDLPAGADGCCPATAVLRRRRQPVPPPGAGASCRRRCSSSTTASSPTSHGLPRHRRRRAVHRPARRRRAHALRHRARRHHGRRLERVDAASAAAQVEAHAGRHQRQGDAASA